MDKLGELVSMILESQNVELEIRERWNKYAETKMKDELPEVKSWTNLILDCSKN